MDTATDLPRDDLNALVVLMADCRDEMAHATQTMERLQARPQEDTIQGQLDALLALLTPQPRCLSWWWLSAGVVVCLVWGAVGWQAARWAFPAVPLACTPAPTTVQPPKGVRR